MTSQVLTSRTKNGSRTCHTTPAIGLVFEVKDPWSEFTLNCSWRVCPGKALLEEVTPTIIVPGWDGSVPQFKPITWGLEGSENWRVVKVTLSKLKGCWVPVKV